MYSPSAERPVLATELTEQEFHRWFWLKAELQEFARGIGVRATGSKQVIADRIGAALAGRTFQEPTPITRPAGPQLGEPLSPLTIIPAGQRCSQVVRTWMQEQIGPGFHFDAPMREFFAHADGTTTMRDAVEHYVATRGRDDPSIDTQFEYNRFTRAWYRKHPQGSRGELLEAWRAYRRTPVDERGSV